MSAARERIELIEHSLRCFALGWLSLIPIVGLGFAAVALIIGLRLWRRFPDAWNPARRYLRAGFVLAGLGTAGTAGTGWLLARILSGLV